MKPDPVIAEIRRVRHEISAEFHHDTAAILRHYEHMQRQYSDRLYRRVGPSYQAPEAPAAAQPS